MYQPADWNNVIGGGGGNYDVSIGVNSTSAHVNSVNKLRNSSTAVTSSAACRSRCNRFVASGVVALLLLTSSVPVL